MEDQPTSSTHGQRLQEPTQKPCRIDGPASDTTPFEEADEIGRSRLIEEQLWRLVDLNRAEERAELQGAGTDKPEEEIWSDGEGPPVLPRPVIKYTYYKPGVTFYKAERCGVDITNGGRTYKEEIDDHGMAADKVKAKARPSI